MASGKIKAETISGTWTPQIPRATITDVSGEYIKVGRLVIASGQCKITASETGNAYILENSIPEKGSGTKRMFGMWENGGISGILANTTNNNAWIYYQGLRIPMTNLINTTFRFILIYVN